MEKAIMNISQNLRGFKRPIKLKTKTDAMRRKKEENIVRNLICTFCREWQCTAKYDQH